MHQVLGIAAAATDPENTCKQVFPLQSRPGLAFVNVARLEELSPRAYEVPVLSWTLVDS